MKIRTDFVTNSSSSSYCVSLIVKTASEEKLELDFWPENEDGSGEVMVPLKKKIDTVISHVRECESVSQLCELLLNAPDLNPMFNEVEDAVDGGIDKGMDNAGYLELIAEAIEEDENGYFEDYAVALEEVRASMSSFRSGMEKITELDDIVSVSIYEYFTGWGEFAREGVEDFIEKALADVDPERVESPVEAFEGKLTEAEIECIVDHMENDSICMFNADITTTVTLSDGAVKKQYSFDADN